MKIFSTILLLIISTSIFCQNKKSILWKISGNGLKEPSYLFGTIHAIPKDDFFIPQQLIQSFLECKNIVLETGSSINMSDSSLKKEIMMPHGRTIKDLYKKRDYQYLQQYFMDSLKLPITNVMTIKPIWILSVISPRWYQNYVGYESMFINKATENKKPVIGLETTQDQFAFMNQITTHQQALMLLNAIQEREKERRNYATTLQKFLVQDVDQINTEIKSQFKEYKNCYDIYFANRNIKWVTKINALIRNQSCFIAVGVGHLGGHDGLISKIKEIGYKVDPL
jgi:uncharacterized protein YbaP (TraB family)